MRLIYEDALIEDLKKWKGLNNKTIEAVLETINKQPTAYDTAKVVAELDKASFLMDPITEGHYADNGVFLDEAIKIVRKGGVE